ncbi:sporulation protein [Streptomyces sp. DSM 44917]|uniref:Sporulation protein n=1 Tax=Streptomyces boetiae TaxID=3075541 RepID=A0ABU2L924_9ACTN|nr:sporulation protein [Streptomyces sp. DSM 44917]MDT0307976.1 sporulation protein [Streptomyces sp. DSM 44917]
MVFKRLLGSLGVGGPTVDTVLDGGPVLPGGTLSGQVHLQGGAADFDIEHVTLELVARVEAEYEEGEAEGVVPFERLTVGGGFRLAEGARHSVSFSARLPWETPVTELHGQPLGVVLGVRTELAVAGARDKGDLDPLHVRALPVQEAVLEALGQLGFGFASADLELGRIHGTGQQLPFYQEIELTPPAAYAYAVNEVEVTFLASPGGVEIVLEADKRGGLFSGGHDAVGRHTVSHDSVGHINWTAEVEAWMRELIEHHAAHHPPRQVWQQGHADPYGHGGGFAHKDGHGHDGGHHSSGGPGMGTVIAAGAAGLAVGAVGGYVAGEVLEEIFEDEGGEEES